MKGKVQGVSRAALVTGALFALAGCASYLPSFSGSSSEQPIAAAPAPPSNMRPDEIVGRWGMAAFQRPEDRARTEAAARRGCSQPFVINRSSVGVAMYGADNPAMQDMLLKGSPEGKTFIGPTPQAAGPGDREVVSFDGRVLVMKWVEPEVASRYGTMVLVRCGAEGTAAREPRRTAAPAPAPAPAPATPR